MARMNKKGVSELISVVLLIVLAVTLSFFVFRWISGNVSEQGEKGADRATATDLCREEIRMRVNNVQDNGDFYIVTVENLRERVLSDFLVRYELGEEVEIKRARQFISGFETGNIKVEKPSFIPSLVKIIPQITLTKPEIQANDQAWWLCSNQLAQYEL